MHVTETSFAPGHPVVVRSAEDSRQDLTRLLRDLYASIKARGFWFYSAWIEILLTYRSTALGPLWIFVGTALFVFVVGNLYGRVVLTGSTNAYMVHMAVGLVVWFFISQTLVGSCRLFWTNRANILDGATSYTDLILKLLTTNLIYLLHNAVIVVAAFIFTQLPITATAWALLLTVPLVMANVLWMSVVLSILGARYADLEEVLHAMLRLLFFVTPILWVPHAHVRGAMVDAALYLNPFYYMLEAIREPLVQGTIPYFEIGVCFAALPVGWLAASMLYARTRASVALWL